MPRERRNPRRLRLLAVRAHHRRIGPILGCVLLLAVWASAAQGAATATGSPPSQALTAPVYGQTWAGYDAVVAAPGAGMRPYFTKITGAWREPAAQCASVDSSQASVWVGLGGVLNTAAVYGPLQIGTDSDCEHGSAVYFAWYEAYPQPLVRVRLRVAPNDALAAMVSVDAAGAPVLTLEDQTSGAGFTKVLRDVHVRPLATDSAEWIVEGPAHRGPILTNFGSVSFTDATATQVGPSGAHSGSVDDPAWSYSEPDVLGGDDPGVHQSAVERSAAPGPLTASGDAFTVSFGAGALGVAQ
jgi:hypothetical protein